MSSRNRAYVPDHDYMPTRREILKPLVAKVYGYGIPSTWKLSFSDSSLVVTTPNRSCSVKVTSDHRVTVDRLIGTKIKSSVFSCSSPEDAWSVLARTLDSLIPKQGGIHA